MPGAGEAAQSAAVLARLLGSLGTASLSGMQASNDVQHALDGVATAYGRPDLRIYVLPTVVLVEDPAAEPPQTEFFPVTGPDLRLEQAGEVERLVTLALEGEEPPGRVLERLDTIVESTPRFGTGVAIAGHTLLTLGFGLVLNPTVTALPVYLALGFIVGCLLRFASVTRTLSLILPVFTAFAMTVLIVKFAQPHVGESVLRLLAPGLMSFLPGLQLTVAAVELTSGQVMAGASRLLYGVARLGLLAFGVYAGMTVLHDRVDVGGSATALGWWAPWLGTLLVGVGYFYFSGAPRGSLLWILITLLVAYAAQSAGNLLVGPQMSGMVGAAVVVLVAYALASLRAAPSSSVLLTCGYWLLVPGALSFIGVGEIVSSTAGAEQAFVSAVISLLSIAIGIIIGVGLSRDLRALRTRIAAAPRDARAHRRGRGRGRRER